MKHCQIAPGSRFLVKQKDDIDDNLGILYIIKSNEIESNKDQLLWYVEWGNGIRTEPLCLPWTMYCELYETETQGYCLCNDCIRNNTNIKT